MQSSRNQYVLVINGKPEGPFSIEELKVRRIKPADFVKTPEMVDYKEAHELEELREIFGFKKRTVMPQYFAAFDQRLLASVLDWFFISGFYIVIAFTAILFIYDSPTRMLIGLSLLVIIPIMNLVYHIVMESSATQATYGKQILKIKVTDIEGKRITPGKAIARNVCKIFSFVSIVGYLMIFFNRHQQGLHDLITDTLVVKDRLF
ncbi:MAG: RDD family protein [Bacteroidetes bacterium]|nr:RDD family protein [Bacteroidota bacterium]